MVLEFSLPDPYSRRVRSVRACRCPVIFAALLFCCAAPIFAQTINITFRQLPRRMIKSDLDSFASSNIAREVKLRQMFLKAGCSPAEITEEQVQRKRPPNIICTLPGSSKSEIIVSAHTDHAEIGEGVVDDWSGAALLPALMKSLAGAPRRHTFVFIGFTDEEDGLVGSHYYVNHLSRTQLSEIRAEVNLECLGLTPTKVWADRANKKLLSDLFNVAGSLKLDLAGVNVDNVADDDTHPFLRKHVPVITIHSVTRNTWPILHSWRDNLRAINFTDYYNSYRLIVTYLAYLDATLKR